MAPPKWQPSPEDIEVIRAHNDMEAARRLGKDDATVRKIRRRLGIPNPYKPGAPESPQANQPLPQPPSGVWTLPEHVAFNSDLWLALETVQQEMWKLDLQRDEVDVTIPGTDPILCLFLSDTHIGHTETNLAQLRADVELVRNTPGVYVILGGDLFDNVVTAVSGRGMHHQQLTPVRVQHELVERLAGYISDRVLAMLLGNHDEWTISSVDYDPTGHLAQQLKCPYLGPQGFINLRVGSQTYRILAAHQFRMRSSFNRTHQGKRLEDFAGEAEVIFTGHTHEPAGESTDRRGQRKFYGQSGSYLKHSRYGKRLGFSETTPEMPAVCFMPDEHRFVGFYDGFRDGIAFLKAIRGQG